MVSERLETVLPVGSVLRLNKELRHKISQSLALNGQLRTSCEMGVASNNVSKSRRISILGNNN
jgi:hypothetical protein